MRSPLLLLIFCFLLAGCEPSFKEEYEATLKELQNTQAKLDEALEKLRAADSEIRHNIFTLMRRASNHLRSNDIEINRIKSLSQELLVHIESYVQLNKEADHVSVTASFYANKLQNITDLLQESRLVYDRRFNECLRGIGNKQQSKNELSNMLCEVQADVAREALNENLHASIYALSAIFEEQLKIGRQGSSAQTQTKTLEQRFRQLITESQEKTTS